MLVTCPECGARYDIDAPLIPAGGRRVQCSACNHVWQQDRDGAYEAEAREPASLRPAPHSSAEPEDEAPLHRPPLADDVKAILREEAEHESRMRRERGLVEIRPRVAPGAGRATAMPQPARAGPLPDAEAINATLRAASERAAESSQARPRSPGRRGFAAGLAVGLAIVAFAAALYLAAPRIAEMAPGAVPWLDAYVVFVDELRLRLDATADGAMAAVSELLSADG